MSKDLLTPEIASRICLHMNKDHKDALLSYARFFGGVKRPVEVEMLFMTSDSMTILVDGKNLEIPFDHKLTDSNDAHQTLVDMMKQSSI